MTLYIAIAKTYTEPAWQTNQTVFGLCIVMQSLEGCPYKNGECQLGSVGREKNLETSLALIGRQHRKRRGTKNHETSITDTNGTAQRISFILSWFVIENTRAGQPQV